ncbi:PTS glucitol/sorbitol transporter subunit IIA [Pantoea sp. App145]|uniref:PTS glucitol/sorbitol transporter subunit IIA n=1 Tax=Pantoea sp. App145 TaxID=3071567 RepID=UPI003A810F9C
MKTIYESTFIAIGKSAAEALDDNFLITFGEGAPNDIAEYCFIHRSDINPGENFSAGALITLGEHQYPITAVGDVARENLRDLGHITLRFDGSSSPEFPGTIHVIGKPPAVIHVGEKFCVFSD